MDPSFRKVDSIPTSSQGRNHTPSEFEEPVRESMNTGDKIAKDVPIEDLNKAKSRLRAVGNKLDVGLHVVHELHSDEETATIYFEVREKREIKKPSQQKMEENPKNNSEDEEFE